LSRFLLAALLALLPVEAGAATLTVTVMKVDPKGGTLRLSLYDEFTWLKSEDQPQASANVPAVAPETVVTLTDIKPGIYGVKLFQDANNDGKFDQNFIGLPLERYGFSRDARPFLSEPGFDRTKFTIRDGENAITIHLQ
jgi:uncharacterized protein (DUF2141 family)